MKLVSDSITSILATAAVLLGLAGLADASRTAQADEPAMPGTPTTNPIDFCIGKPPCLFKNCFFIGNRCQEFYDDKKGDHCDCR